MTQLADQVCEPCRGGMPRLTAEEIPPLLARLEADWTVVEDHHLTRTFRFPDFAEALAFTIRVGALAEEAGHHPDVYLAWGQVRLDIWTHKIDGLHLADFVLAARAERAYAP